MPPHWLTEVAVAQQADELAASAVADPEDPLEQAASPLPAATTIAPAANRRTSRPFLLRCTPTSSVLRLELPARTTRARDGR
jgi:hypothetical protein